MLYKVSLSFPWEALFSHVSFSGAFSAFVGGKGLLISTSWKKRHLTWVMFSGWRRFLLTLCYSEPSRQVYGFPWSFSWVLNTNSWVTFQFKVKENKERIKHKMDNWPFSSPSRQKMYPKSLIVWIQWVAEFHLEIIPGDLCYWCKE